MSEYIELKNVTGVFVNPTTKSIIVTGIPEPDDESHNCDEMGCTSVEHTIYRFNAPEGRRISAEVEEVQRLRAAAIKLHETINSFWQGDCDKADVVAAQSKLCDVLGADRDDELYGDWTDERCPKCGANLLGNKVGDKWCSMVGCDYSINAEGDGNDV